MILREKINTVTGVATNIVVKLRAMLVCTVSNKSFATRQPSFFWFTVQHDVTHRYIVLPEIIAKKRVHWCSTYRFFNRFTNCSQFSNAFSKLATIVVCKCDTRAHCMHRTLYTGCGRKLCTSGHEAIPYEKNKKKYRIQFFPSKQFQWNLTQPCNFQIEPKPKVISAVALRRFLKITTEVRSNYLYL